MDSRAGTGAPSSWSIWAALLLIYVVWGSTYLAIKLNVETLPPLVSGGARFLAAGALLSLLLLARRGRGGMRVTRRELVACAAAAALLLVGGVGMVMLAETKISSSLAAIAGLGGVALVVLPHADVRASAVGVLIALGASVSWATGSFISRRLPLPADPFLATALEMLAGGAILLTLGLARGEAAGLDLGAVSGRSLGGLAYLAVAGSLVSFSAYVWLLRHVPISKVVTHQYANPLVAVLLGWAILSERIGPTVLAGAALVVGSVAIVVRRESGPVPDPAPAEAG